MTAYGVGGLVGTAAFGVVGRRVPRRLFLVVVWAVYAALSWLLVPMPSLWWLVAVLFAIGLVHATLFASNDVLRAYALAGLALPLLAGLSAQGLVTVALGLLCLHFALGLAVLGAPLAMFHVKHSGADALLWAERQFGHDAATIAALGLVALALSVQAAAQGR